MGNEEKRAAWLFYFVALKLLWEITGGIVYVSALGGAVKTEKNKTQGYTAPALISSTVPSIVMPHRHLGFFCKGHDKHSWLRNSDLGKALASIP